MTHIRNLDKGTLGDKQMRYRAIATTLSYFCTGASPAWNYCRLTSNLNPFQFHHQIQSMTFVLNLDDFRIGSRLAILLLL